MVTAGQGCRTEMVNNEIVTMSGTLLLSSEFLENRILFAVKLGPSRQCHYSRLGVQPIILEMGKHIFLEL